MFMRKVEMVYFDIETRGLDPMNDQVTAVGILYPKDGEIDIKTAARRDHERDVLVELITKLMTTPAWGGWNITEFDLSFLAVRAQLNDLEFPVTPVKEEPWIGKYGNIRVVVPARKVHDLCYDVKDEDGDPIGMTSSLQHAAQEIGWEPSIRMDGRVSAIAPIGQVVAHLADDLAAIHALVNRYGGPS